MRKSNILIAAIATVASIFFLWLWYYLQFNLVDNPLDLVLTICWWVIIAVVCVIIHKVEKTRQERLRTCLVAPGLVYNAEAGNVATAGSAVDAIQSILQDLDYGFGIAEQRDEAKEDPKAFYDLVVRSSKFSVEKDEGTGERQVKEWEGEVASTADPDAPARRFTSREELEAILAA